MGISMMFCIGRILWTIIHYHRNDLSHLSVNQQQQINRKYCQILTSPTVGHLCILGFLLCFQVILILFFIEFLAFTFDVSLDPFSFPFGTYFGSFISRCLFAIIYRIDSLDLHVIQ